MYLDHFSLKIKPFQITVDPKFLWLGEKHKEALATLRYGILDNRGFLLMTGEVGTGKTILINRLISLLDMDTVVATLPDPDLESMDFYNLLADGLDMKRTFDTKGEFLIHLRDFLHQSHVDQKQVLLIIDESQRLNHRLMEDIRVLSNIELQDRKLINIFFVGQQEFNSVLLTPQNRALSQRITVRYHIEALNAGEVGEYIRHRLNVAGAAKQIFEPSAVSEIYHVSGGIPRLINIVCDHAMLTAYAKSTRKIDAQIVKECAEELRIPIQKPKADAAGVKTVKRHPDAAEKLPVADLNREPSAVITTPEENAAKKRPSAVWHLIYAAIIILLLGGIALLIGERNNRPAANDVAKDLTPRTYQTAPEMEKKPVADRLNSRAVDADAATPPPTPPAAVDVTAPALTPPTAVEAPDRAMPPPKPDHRTGEGAPVAQRPPGSERGDKKEQTIEVLPLLKSKVTIPFTINSNEIDDGFYPVLDQIATYLTNHPRTTVGVKGYTDNSGSPTYNESVSGFRAGTVQSYLIGKGVAPERIETFAMGGANPVASNTTFQGRKRNRRVEIEFYNQETF